MLRSGSGTVRTIAILLTVVGSLGLRFGVDSALGQPQKPTAAANSIEPNDPNAVKRKALVTAESVEAETKLTLEDLRARKKRATELADLAEETKAKLTETYDKAITQFQQADELTGKKNQYRQAAKAAPVALKEIQNSLAESAAITSPTIAPDVTLAQAEQALTQATLGLEDAKTRAVGLEGEPKRRADRRTRIPEESNAAMQLLDEIQKKLTAVPVAEEPSALAEANRILLQLQRRVQQSRIDANREELLFYDAANDLLAAQRDAAARQVATQERLLTFWQEKVAALRQQAAQTAKEEAVQAERDTRSAHPTIRAIAQENARLAELQARLVNEIQEIGSYSEAITAKLATARKDLEELSQQVETAGGVTDTMGMLLLGRRDKLPRINENERQIRSRATEIASAQLLGMECDKKWAELGDLADEMLAIEGEFEPSLSPEQQEALKAEAAGYLESQRKTLQAIVFLSWDKATKLAELDISERSLVKTVENLADFINANVLWVKSSDVLRFSDLGQTFDVLIWLVAPTNWHGAGVALWTDLQGNSVGYALIVVAILATIVALPKLRHQIMRVSEEVRQIQTDSFLLTIRAFVFTTVLAAMWPLCLLLISWRLSAAGTDSFLKALASGFRGLAFVFFVLNFLRYLTMPHGLAQDHFRLREASLVSLRWHLRWLFALALPVVFVLEAMHGVQAEQRWYATGGRLLFMVGLLALAVFHLIVLRPGSTFMEPYLKQRRGSWLDRLRYLWYPLCVLLPLGIAALAGMGYFYGARHLNVKLLLTGGLVLAIALIRGMFVRGLVVAQRHLALLERQRRQDAAERTTKEADAASPAPSGLAAESKTRSEPTIFEISQQTRRLIATVTTILLVVGIWYIWDDVLPAFEKLGERRLYGVDDKITTLGSVLTALVVTILTVIVARNVPGLLEITILRRLPLDRGIRFAIITLCRYILIIVGVVLAFTEIGIGWAKVQWLIAAMTVGLGFGLQEIFANFVSGLIILFEQPIRVDDIVTVGDVTGRVTMIKIRATTIRRWDQRELIVPNKEFITGQLINWTLSDNILRRDFPVGIAYGSDIREAERLLYEIAETDVRVLKDPAPTVLFKGFGDSSLDFELRVNYSGIENNLPLWHDINVAIDDKFREAGVEIAFPQRDLHLRSVDSDIPFNFGKHQP